MKKYTDLVGSRFGEWSVLKDTPDRYKNGSKYWICQCSCGFIKSITTNALLTKKTTKCRPCATKKQLKDKYNSIREKENLKSQYFYNRFINENNNLDSLLFAMVLGDSHIKRKSLGACLSMAHCRKQKDYLIFKSNIIKKIYDVSLNYKDRDHYYKKLNKYYPQTYLWTKNNPYFTALRMLFYKPKKIINELILSKLDEKSLAIWYMDDGSLVNNSINLSTHNFTLEENTLIKNWFKEKWNIESKVIKSKHLYFIRFDVNNSLKFLDIVRDTVIQVPCMSYKLNTKNVRKKKGEIKNGN